MSLDYIDRRRVAWCIVIQGMPVRLYGGADPSALTAGMLRDYTDTVVQTPTDIDCVLDVGAYEARLDDRAGIADETPIHVTVLARDARTSAGVRVQPYHYLMRVGGPDAADRRVRLAVTLPHAEPGAGPAVVAIAESAAAWDLPGPVHIGHETIWADGYLDALGVHMLTDCTRGADGWTTQQHTVDEMVNERPRVTSHVTAWRGRICEIWCSAILESGVAAGWVRYWTGVLDGPPEHRDETISLRVASLAAVAEYRLGVGSSARVCTAVPGAHLLTPGVADVVGAGIRWDCTEWRPFRAVLPDPGVDDVRIDADSAVVFDAMGLGAGDYLSIRSVDAAVFGNGGDLIEEAIVSWATPVLTFGGGSALAAEAKAQIAVSPMLYPAGWFGLPSQYDESFAMRLTDPDGAAEQVVAWPDHLSTVLNGDTGYQDGPIGSWADPEASGGEGRIGRMAIRVGDGAAIIAHAIDEASKNGGPRGRLRIRAGADYCTVGFPPTERALADARAFRVADWRIEGADGIRRIELDADIRTAAGRADPVEIPLPPLPVWYYQSGEQYIGPFDRDIYTGGGAEQLIEVRTARGTHRVWVDAVYDAPHPVDGVTVYWYQVVERHRQTTFSFLCLPEDDLPTAGVVPGAVDAHPGEYLFQLLNSGVGNTDNGSGDVMPLGANLPIAILDTNAFTSMASPENLRGQDYVMQRGSTIREQCEGLLIASGYQLANVRMGSGGWVLSLVSMAPPTDLDSALDITDDDLLLTSGPPVKVSVDGRTVRSVVVRINHEGDEATEIPVSLGMERSDAGGDAGQPLTLDLPGVVVASVGSQAQAAAEIVADLRTRVGVPRVRWSFSIRADAPGALELALGSVVTLTSEHVYGIVPTDDVVAVPCRVLGIRRDLPENRLDLEVRPYPALAGGWAPAALVTVVNNASKVTVGASVYSQGTDADLFAAGDVVSCVPRGNWSGRTVRTIVDVTGSVITLSGAHGLAVGDTIRHDDYAPAIAARPELASYAFLADSDGLLDGTDPGKVIA